MHKTTERPTRTFSPASLMPTRTSKFMNLFSFDPISKLYNNLTLLKSTIPNQIDVNRASSATHDRTEKNLNFRKMYVDDKINSNLYKKTDVSSKSFEKENELFYNNLFYNDDDDVECTKTQENVENINVAKIIKNTSESITTSDFTSNNVTEADDIDNNYEDEDESYNVIVNTTAKSIFGVATLPEIAKPNNSTRKRPICSVMRSSPLTFSRPQTLHEVLFKNVYEVIFRYI